MYGDEILKEAEAAGLGEPESDGKVYSLEVSPAMRLLDELSDQGELQWVPAEPALVNAEPEFERMTGTYLDVSRRAIHLNARQQQSGFTAWIFYPAPVEPLGSR
ncbi:MULTISPECIES: hypothetical protein [unclassified Microbacterium]|uniref:hypothetical protein n=1 Tax=unclassified Microbacterium TaxID=2609290 RepID=UPI0034391790